LFFVDAFGVGAIKEFLVGFVATGFFIDASHDTFLDGTLRNYAADSNPRSRLVVGPWGHDDWLTHLVGDRNLGVAGSGDAFGLFDRELEFYSAAIAGEDPPMARVSV